MVYFLIALSTFFAMVGVILACYSSYQLDKAIDEAKEALEMME